MSHDTEYLGHLTVTPPLNPAEVEWLSGFADWGAISDGDPYRLPMNPRAELVHAFAQRNGAMRQPGIVPAGVRDWRVWANGVGISWQRAPNSNDAEATMRFLVDHYLRPDARAKHLGGDDFAQFTFDHRLDGVVAAWRSDTEELYLIRVEDNEIYTETLVAGASW